MLTQELLRISLDNQKFFQFIENGEKFVEVSKTIIKTLVKIEPLVDEIRNFAGSYDFDKQTPGNGYRSFVFLVDIAVKKTWNVSKLIQDKRENFFFCKKFYEKYSNFKKKSLNFFIKFVLFQGTCSLR